jgi:hypothetical protein
MHFATHKYFWAGIAAGVVGVWVANRFVLPMLAPRSS